MSPNNRKEPPKLLCPSTRGNEAPWCDAKRLSPLPASAHAVAAFLAFEVRNGTKPTTLARRLAAIRYAHNLAGQPSPTASEVVKATLRGIKRTLRHSPARKAPAT
jgi:hypothetical protein